MQLLNDQEFACQAGYEWHNMPQVDYISWKGRIVVKDVFGFENLRDDWPIIRKTTGIKAPLRHVNQSERDDYRRYYDEETYDLVAARYARDIDEFGYKF